MESIGHYSGSKVTGDRRTFVPNDSGECRYGQRQPDSSSSPNRYPKPLSRTVIQADIPRRYSKPIFQADPEMAMEAEAPAR